MNQLPYDIVSSNYTPEVEVEKPPGSSRILFVDDDEIFLHLCKRYLRSDGATDHTIVSANTIQEALLAFSVDNFDCVIVDYRLPDGNGTEAIDRLRDKAGRTMPCTIILTGQSGEQAAIDAVRSGANDFLTKGSLTKAALCRAVNNAIEKNHLRRLHLSRVQDLEVANSLLRRRNEEIQRFYHTVSHEVKTPLTAIQEFVSIVYDGLAGNVSEEQKTILNYALQSCDQIKCQFDELLELSRFETGKMQVTLEPSCIYEVLDHCVVPATPAAVAKNITLLIEDEPDLPLVLMQSDRIIQVLSNLIGNALKFTPECGMVTVGVGVTEAGDKVKVSVKDTGRGIPAEDIKHIFDRLYQVEPAINRETQSGMGLGLSIAAQIIDLHGSEFEVTSTVGEGSEFSFALNVFDPKARSNADL